MQGRIKDYEVEKKNKPEPIAWLILLFEEIGEAEAPQLLQLQWIWRKCRMVMPLYTQKGMVELEWNVWICIAMYI